DMNPGTASSIGTVGGANFANVGGTLFFTAASPGLGTELWKSDGTAEGTVLVKDINPGSASSTPLLLTNVGETLFFRASEAATGGELWKSDGTAEGTVLVKDINRGSEGSFPRGLTEGGGMLVVAAV